MTKEELILACMAAGDKALYRPVHIQKLIFIFQDKMKHQIGGEVFSFVPYDYGPFDPSIYHCLEKLAIAGQVSIFGEPLSKNRAYALTDAGCLCGIRILDDLDPQVGEFLKRLSSWVRSLGFAELVSSVYAAFPEMKRNSIFRE